MRLKVDKSVQVYIRQYNNILQVIKCAKKAYFDFATNSSQKISASFGFGSFNLAID